MVESKSSNAASLTEEALSDGVGDLKSLKKVVDAWIEEEGDVPSNLFYLIDSLGASEAQLAALIKYREKKVGKKGFQGEPAI